MNNSILHPELFWNKKEHARHIVKKHTYCVRWKEKQGEVDPEGFKVNILVNMAMWQLTTCDTKPAAVSGPPHDLSQLNLDLSYSVRFKQQKLCRYYWIILSFFIYEAVKRALLNSIRSTWLSISTPDGYCFCKYGIALLQLCMFLDFTAQGQEAKCTGIASSVLCEWFLCCLNKLVMVCFQSCRVKKERSTGVGSRINSGGYLFQRQLIIYTCATSGQSNALVRCEQIFRHVGEKLTWVLLKRLHQFYTSLCCKVDHCEKKTPSTCACYYPCYINECSCDSWGKAKQLQAEWIRKRPLFSSLLCLALQTTTCR